MKIHPIILAKKFSAVLIATMKPLGAWGLGGLALLDAAFIPLPTSMDGTVLLYVRSEPSKFLLYCFVAAVASAIGGLVPYYIGRAGGEFFLLKRINRQRYERIRDRFEKQEFLAIMIPAMGPPPTPVKLFEFAAGVFEMKVSTYFCAVFTGKFTQFLILSILYRIFGPRVIEIAKGLIREHASMMWSLSGIVLVVIIVFILRKVFSRRGGTPLPIEEAAGE